MERATVAASVTDNLDDLNSTFYTASDVNESIKDAYDRVAAITGCLTKAVTIVNRSQPYWDLAASVPDYLYPVGIWNFATNQWLDAVSRIHLDSQRLDWELWNGQPIQFSPIDFRRIAIAPHLSATSGTLLLIYRASPPILFDSSVFSLPASSESVLENYSTADLLEQAKEFNRANIFWKDYVKDLENCKREVRNLAATDRIRVLEPYSAFPRFGPGGDQIMFVDNEIPGGTINGTNAIFTLVSAPNPAGSLSLLKNGIYMFQNVGYILSGSTITFNSGYIPQTGDLIRANYRIQ